MGQFISLNHGETALCIVTLFWDSGVSWLLSTRDRDYSEVCIPSRQQEYVYTWTFRSTVSQVNISYNRTPKAE